MPTPDLDDALRWVPAPGRPPMVEVHDLDRDAMYGDLFRVLAESAVSPG